MTPGRIGGYEILSELGRGAMGVVYHAHDFGIGRPVAIKVIRVGAGTSAQESAELRQRLIREASTAGKIYHPGIVTVHQLGEEDDNVFIVMEYVEGSSLEHLLNNNPQLGLAWTIDILRQVADALDYAHRSQVVHRDVKPGNILVRSDGRVKIADFGIAKMSGGSSMTGTGVSLGSPAYMSPEQVQAVQIDGRSDQFALGTIAFQMLAGRMPFKGDTAHTVMYQIVTADPFEAQPGDVPLSAEVRAVLERVLAKNSRDRFPDCATFVQELSQAVGAGRAVSQTSTAKMEPIAAPVAAPAPAPPEKKFPLLPVIGGVLALLLIGGIYWYIHRTCCAPPPVVPAANAQRPLIKAIIDGDEAVGRLVSKDTVNAANPDGMTPLLTAVTYGKMEIVKSLLAAGANVNTANHDGATPLMIASEGTAYLPNNLPLVQLLLTANPSLEAQDSRGRTALDRAAQEGKLDVARLLLDSGARIDSKANDGATALLRAVEFGQVPMLQLLIERHAQVDLPDASGNTPLMVASEGNAYLPNNAPMVEALLTAGAHVDSVDARGRSSLYRASGEGKEDAMRLLLDHQANVNLRSNDRSTPLIAAVTFAKLSAAGLLIERGADVNLGDANETTPLMIAADSSPYIKNPAEFIKLLLDHGAKKALADARGRNAYQRAVESKNTAAVELLK